MYKQEVMLEKMLILPGSIFPHGKTVVKDQVNQHRCGSHLCRGSPEQKTPAVLSTHKTDKRERLGVENTEY